MNALSAGAVLQEARYASFKQCNNDASIENKVSKALTNNTSIELPQEIKALITGNDFWVNAKTNRYKMLIRQGHIQTLLRLAKMSRENATKRDPSWYFAHCCSKDQWEEYTLPLLAKIYAAAKKAAHVTKKLGIKINKFIHKQIWQGVNVVRWADWAAEIAHDKPGQSREKHFAWLCLNEQRLAI